MYRLLKKGYFIMTTQRWIYGAILWGGLLLGLAHRADAQSVPDLLNFNGILTDAAGVALTTDNYGIEFNIYDAESAGNVVWGPMIFDGVLGSPGHGGKIPVVNGQFNILLGPMDTSGRLLREAFPGGARYLSIQVEGEAELSPRPPILSVAYAMKAARANQLGAGAVGLNATGDVTVNSHDVVLQGDGVLSADQGSVSAAQFEGDGAAVTNLSADHIATGRLSNDRLPNAIAVTGAVETSGGRLIGPGSNLTHLNASAIATGVLPNSAMPNNINITGTLTAGSFAGDGRNLSNINGGMLSNLDAGSIGSGTLSNDRLPSPLVADGIRVSQAKVNSPATPLTDGRIVVSGSLGVGITPSYPLHIKGTGDNPNPVLFLEPTADSAEAGVRLGNADNKVRYVGNSGAGMELKSDENMVFSTGKAVHVNGMKPFQIRTYELTSTETTKDITNFSTADWAAAVVGIQFLDGRLEHVGAGDIYAYMSKNGDSWRINCDFFSRTPHESHTITVLFISTRLARVNY